MENFIFRAIIDVDSVFGFRGEAYHISKLLSQICCLNSTDGPIPLSFNDLTNKNLTKVNSDEQLISKLNLDLNSHKAHGHDQVSAHMLQVCLDSISKLLSIIFKNYLKTGCYPTIWKKANVATYTKKEVNKLWTNRFYLSVVNSLKKLYSVQLFSIWQFV